MKRLGKYLLILSLTAWTQSALGGAKQGEALHSTYCIECHASMFDNNGADIYLRPDRRVTTRGALERQVRRCRDNLGLHWSGDQISDVVEYLDATYYRFSITPRD